VYALRTGDFDVKVRVTSLGATDPSAKAGLMARASLSASSPTLHLDVMAPPPMRSTTEAMMRPTSGASTVGWGWAGTPYNAGLLPTEWPNVWLRFTRTGNVFRGYASRDAIDWTQYAETSQTFPSTLYVGLASTAHNNATQTTARLRDYGPYEGALVEAMDTSGLAWSSRATIPGLPRPPSRTTAATLHKAERSTTRVRPRSKRP